MIDVWAELPVFVRTGIGFLFGAIHGWLGAVIIERVPRGIGVSGLDASTRSRCACGHQLLARENVPVISFLAQRGRARCCGARIPRWYLVAEIGMGAAWGLAALVSHLALAVLTAVAVFFAVVLSGVGWERRRLARKAADHR